MQSPRSQPPESADADDCIDLGDVAEPTIELATFRVRGSCEVAGGLTIASVALAAWVPTAKG